LEKRHSVYQLARELNPSRWSNKTRNWSETKIVELNPGRLQKNKESQLAA
jgi:hypothetical protein